MDDPDTGAGAGSGDGSGGTGDTDPSGAGSGSGTSGGVVSDPTLIGQLSGILLSPTCQQINFCHAGIFVTSAAYTEITSSLQADSPDVFVVSGVPPSGAAAYYDPSSRSITLSGSWNSTNLADAMTAVHETTHAILDINDNGMNWVDGEIVAYVAAALFVTFTVPSGWSPDNGTNRIILQALAIASNIANSPGASVPSDGAATLRSLISSDPVYAGRR